MKIDPKRQGVFPPVSSPRPFLSPDGQFRGWKVEIPGHHTLATPAVVDGRIFLGGGFGSYEFYAFDAANGTLLWEYQTSDDGPTAAVVDEDYVVFNTESCELEVLTVEGHPVWKKWLGDPLMSMPAVGNGRVYIAYPDSQGDHRHYLACFDLRTGTEHWKEPIEGEIITAPILSRDHVYFATLGGTLYRVRRADGHVEWKEPRKATSAPVVWEGECYFSQRQEVAGGSSAQDEVHQTEHLSTWGLHAAVARNYMGTSRQADYLDHMKRASGSKRFTVSGHKDAAVGFSQGKGDAKIEQAMSNLGQGHVHSIWAFQGSKPFISKARLYAAHGDLVNAADPHSEVVFWKKPVGQDSGDAKEMLDSPLTPPAIANDKLFFATIHGTLHCLSVETGEERWNLALGEPIVFQPAVAGGRVYVGTDSGSLICIETGDPDDDGWIMWGGDAKHNGRLD